jgi:TPR repeat protein
MKFTRWHAAVAIILVLASATATMAGPLDDADAAIKRRDYATALRIVRPLAERGDANAQYNLGVFYDNGLGVPQDRIRAYMWLDLAAMQGRESAATFRDLVARVMTPGQIAEAQKLAREWKPKPEP